MADRTEHDDQERSFFAAIAGEDFDPAGKGQFAVIPDDYQVATLEAFQERPNRHFADERFVDVASLVTYLNRFADDDTMISADYDSAQVVAVIDGHAPDDPSHRTHHARFTAAVSDQTKAWLGICGRQMSQIDFGLFLEDRAVDVVEPDAADVMDMVMTFDATKKVSFQSSQRLHDGQRQFRYVEENQATGAVTLPDHFVILAPVFRGMEPQRIKFMVRYRIVEGALRFQVDMHDRDRVMREAFDRCVDALKNGLKLALPVYVTG